MHAILGFLRRRGLALGALTNSASPYREPFERAGLAAHFDAVVFSCEIGVRKPEEASYRHVLIPEVNLGQLLLLIRARYLIDAIGYDRVRGKPFRIAEIIDEAERVLAEDPS